MTKYSQDRIGRKPVILFGLLGTTIATLFFGFASKSFIGAVAARCLSGALVGNVPVLFSALGEIAETSNADPSRAYSLMGLAWNTASVIGPVVGYVFHILY